MNDKTIKIAAEEIERLTRERDEARNDVYELKKDVEMKNIVIENRTEAIDNLIDELNEARAWAKAWKKAAKMWWTTGKKGKAFVKKWKERIRKRRSQWLDENWYC